MHVISRSRARAADGSTAIGYVATIAVVGTLMMIAAHALPVRDKVAVGRAVASSMTRLVRDGNISISRHGRRTVGALHGIGQPRVSLHPSGHGGAHSHTRKWAHRSLHWNTTARTGPIAHHLSLDSCVVCIGATASGEHSFGAEARHETTGSTEHGLLLGATAQSWLSIVSGGASASSRWNTQWVRAHATTTARGNVGADAQTQIDAAISRRLQRLTIEGNAVAGATARIEHRSAVHVAGVGISALAGAEGWLGAGARARLHVEHSRRGVWSYDTEFGAGLGLGGAFHLAGSIDVSNLTGHP